MCRRGHSSRDHVHRRRRVEGRGPGPLRQGCALGGWRDRSGPGIMSDAERQRHDLRFAAQDARFEAFVRERFDSRTKLVVFAVLGALLTTAGIALGSAAL